MAKTLGEGTARVSRRWCGLALLCLGLLPRALAAQDTAETRTFNAAVRDFDDGFFERAEREFTEFLQSFPNSPQAPEAILYQARAALRQQKQPEAIGLLTTNLSRAGALADKFRYWLGEFHLRSSNYQAAAQTFGSLIQEFPQSPRLLEASYGEAMARFKLGDWRGVIDRLQDPEGTFQREAGARANDELVVRGHLLLGEALLEDKQFQAAEQAVDRLTESELIPEYKWRRRYLLCRIQVADQRLSNALTHTTNLLDLAAATGQPDLQAESVALRGQILEQVGEPEAALETYAHNLAETVPLVRRRQAFLKTIELTLAQDRVLEAAQKLEAFFAQYPEDAGSDLALLTLGELHLKQHLTQVSAARTNGLRSIVTVVTNHLEAAQSQFDKLINTFTNSPLLGKAHLDRGWCLWLNGKVAESASAFQEAANRLPTSEDLAVARFKLADAQFFKGDFTNALRNYDSVIAGFVGLERVQDSLVGPALYQVLRASLEIGDLHRASNAVCQILQDFPTSPLADAGLLLVGQGYIGQGQPAEARRLFDRFLREAPPWGLRPEIRLGIARTFVEENQWAAAMAQYEAWLGDFSTNALRPQAAFNLAWATGQAGLRSNALTRFTNFLAEFPTHELAPPAQFWVAGFYFDAHDFTNAQASYQRLIENTNWPVTPLTYQARMMAGRAAFARQGWSEARAHFTNLVNDVNCPSNLVAEALFALGDTLIAEEGDPARPARKFEDAQIAFSKIPLLYPSSELVPRAWGRVGDCFLQMASQDPKYYDNALEAYQKVLAPELNADVDARSQAEMGLGLVLERQAQTRKPPDHLSLLKAALDHYLNVVHGKNLRDGEALSPVWLKEAGLAAARLAEELRQWPAALNVYQELAALIPQLGPALQKKMERAREQTQAQSPAN
jgi:TolA-binding protein